MFTASVNLPINYLLSTHSTLNCATFLHTFAIRNTLLYSLTLEQPLMHPVSTYTLFQTCNKNCSIVKQ